MSHFPLHFYIFGKVSIRFYKEKILRETQTSIFAILFPVFKTHLFPPPVPPGFCLASRHLFQAGQVQRPLISHRPRADGAPEALSAATSGARLGNRFLPMLG